MNTASLHQQLERLRSLWPTLGRRFDARPFRERLMITVAVLAAGVALVDRLWLDGVVKRYRSHQAEYTTWMTQSQAVATEIDNQARELRTLEQSKAQQVEEVRKRLADAQAALHDNQHGVVSAQQMLPLLEQLLQSSSCTSGQTGCNRLRVRSVKSLGRSEVTLRAIQQEAVQVPGTAVAASAPPGVQAPSSPVVAGPALWRHGLEITLEGGYADLSAYVRNLEALPQRVLRGGMSFQVEAYPKATLTLTLYTLSLDQSWLEI